MSIDMNNTVTARGIHKRFGDTKVLHGVDLAVDKGEVVVIMGPSGSGKTTLLRSLNFLEQPDSGMVQIAGIQVNIAENTPYTSRQKKDIEQIRRKSAMVFQSFNLFPHMTAIANVIEGLVSVQGMPVKAAREKGLALLERVGLSHKADAYPAHLSGGQKQRVAIARGLAMDPEVILFDEPTSALDPELRDGVLDVMRDLARDGMTMLVVTHEVRFAKSAANRIIFMEQGAILADCAAETFFSGQTTPRIAQFLGQVR
ncbi:amino acid ABC transporter ATP-binding protein [Advenella mimigardefordensis]|uniref:Amino acid ABC transporter ATP-binding protein n=1 Tax=Advenella mimigardefordensis (strain DSM 17166 / LMG 22922 / DPN7) TaxID=1247726 RepID=W0PFU2_ADVMD|nr:amino acid ABC transporter ATP-binding protein [Advenella mimigardefordensis]AHG65874.1 amino acid ABC transporter ATP-binding protein [Advenella mimigardefordensis DPN7]